ncbi:hypothetical protein ACK350_12795, partial [Aeromonas veronii]
AACQGIRRVPSGGIGECRTSKLNSRLTLHPDDMNELKRILQQFNSNLYLTCQPPTLAIAKRALNMN